MLKNVYFSIDSLRYLIARICAGSPFLYIEIIVLYHQGADVLCKIGGMWIQLGDDPLYSRTMFYSCSDARASMRSYRADMASSSLMFEKIASESICALSC